MLSQGKNPILSHQTRLLLITVLAQTRFISDLMAGPLVNPIMSSSLNCTDSRWGLPQRGQDRLMKCIALLRHFLTCPALKVCFPFSHPKLLVLAQSPIVLTWINIPRQEGRLELVPEMERSSLVMNVVEGRGDDKVGKAHTLQAGNQIGSPASQVVPQACQKRSQSAEQK